MPGAEGPTYREEVLPGGFAHRTVYIVAKRKAGASRESQSSLAMSPPKSVIIIVVIANTEHSSARHTVDSLTHVALRAA